MEAKRKIPWRIILSLLFGIIGLLIMLYPVFSAWYTEQTRSEIRTEYSEVIATVDDGEFDAARVGAQKYNQRLFLGQLDLLDPVGAGYFEQLDLTGSGIMGYIRIPKIDVVLPIYHGVSDEVLTKGAGHMSQSSLPVGGDSTHSVISAHSGMASSPMFSDLSLLAEGDTFELEVLGDVLTYQVDSIKTVLPTQIDDIQIQAGEDLCTLITCTPYGVNTHRLLVRGHRIETIEDTVETPPTEDVTVQEDTEDDTPSIWSQHYLHSILYGVGIALFIILLLRIIVWFKQHRKEG